jgi:hypothetical protein
VTKRGRPARACIACVAALAALILLAQACGGGSANVDVTPTATSPPAAAADGETPGSGPSFSGQAGPGAQVVSSGAGASEEFATFLGISLGQLESELSAEGATPASVAEAHDRTRDELKTFFTQQQQAQLSEAVAAGTMSQEDADQMLETFTSRIDDIIDGNVAVGGGPGAGPVTHGGGLFIGGPSEEFAAFLGISVEQLESELNAEGATPGSVAEAHGRTRDELKTFLTGQVQAQVVEGVVNGTISPDDAGAMIERLTSSLDDIIDRSMPSGGPPPTPSGQ